MRFLLAGLLALWPAALALGQARGHVESIGFGGVFRPGCWTPMVVYLVPTTGSEFVGRIEVVQEDLDRDLVRFTRQVNFRGNPAGGASIASRFWMYFIPQPSKQKGAVIDGTQTPTNLTDIIKVRLCTDNGKELVKLPITLPMAPLEGNTRSEDLGQKAVLCVYDRHRPDFNAYDGRLLGLKERINAIGLREVALGLPDDVIGYDSIDCMVWSDAKLDGLADAQVKAVEEFVKRGGHLIILQDTETNRDQLVAQRFASLMPVTVTGVDAGTETDPETGRLKATFSLARLAGVNPAGKSTDSLGWAMVKGPLRTANAIPKSQAQIVVYDGGWRLHDSLPSKPGDPPAPAFATLPLNQRPRPFIVRKPFGAGCVTWVAQDLGQRLFHEPTSTKGWEKIWDTLFEWRNEIKKDTTNNPWDRNSDLAPNASVELGTSMLPLMDLPSTSAALVGIAVLFFVLYWAAAGPGSFWALSRKGKSHMSWFAFGVMAIAATAMTYLIVKLVLRGEPQLQHVTYVRAVRGEPQSVRSQFGLYIPRDGLQRIELKDAAPGRASYVTAFPLHPAFNSEESEYLNHQEYVVPVREVVEQDRPGMNPRVVQVPYRSTMKKFQAQWTGTLGGGIDGTPTLHWTAPLLRGEIRNNTGRDLRMVYLVFKAEREGVEPVDKVLYISKWRSGDRLLLTQELDPKSGGAAPLSKVPKEATFFNPSRASDVVRWQADITRDRTTLDNVVEVWFKPLRQNRGFGPDDDRTEKDPLTPALFPLMSFYDRLPVSKNAGTNEHPTRFEILRRGMRHLDISSAVAGGDLAIIAVDEQGDRPLPFPLEVEGRRVNGKGVVYYQFVVPIDRSEIKRPPPVPATQPATQKTT